MDPQAVATWAGAIGAVGGIVWAVYSKAKPTVQAYMVERKKKSLRAMVRRIEYQLYPNGGTNLVGQVAALRILGEQAVRAGEDNSAAIKALADSIHDGIAEVDAEGRWTWANATLSRWLHCSEQKLLGWGWINAVVEDERNELRAAWREALHEQRELTCSVPMCGTDSAEPILTDWVLRPLTRHPDGSPRVWRLQIHRRNVTLRHVAVDDSGQPQLQVGGQRG